ncbi:MAG: ATP-binding protein [Acidobacteriota bacterium]
MESTYYFLNPWWENRTFDCGIPREPYLRRLPDMLGRRQVEVLIGSRRAGKTTIAKQLVNAMLQNGSSPNDLVYLALDLPSLSGMTLSEHLRAIRKIHMHDRSRKIWLFLDEVQESPNWESELKAQQDFEMVKIFATGSTASLIKSQGGKLTGRQVVTTVYPLSFREFLLFRGGVPDMSEDYKLERLADEYIRVGGYPEHVLNPSDEYLANLVEDILARDLVRLYSIRRPAVLRDLLRLVASAVASRTSYNRLSKLIGLSVDTVKEYIGHLEAAFLVSAMEKWTTSWSDRVYSAKKLYLWDTGVKTVLTGPGDAGARAENAVWMELKRRSTEAGYFAESEREVDFVVGSAGEPFPIEVKFVSTLDWQDRRLSGLFLFLRRNPRSRRALVVTHRVEGRKEVDRCSIDAVPLWKFLLRSEQWV